MNPLDALVKGHRNVLMVVNRTHGQMNVSITPSRSRLRLVQSKDEATRVLIFVWA